MSQPVSDSQVINGFVKPASYTVAALPTTTTAMPGLVQGATVYCTNCRVLTDTVGIGGALTFVQQGAGAGTGSLVTWSGSAWQLPGTTIPAQA